MSPSPDPLEIFGRWLETAIQTEPRVPDAMSVATVDERGAPSSRMVLLKDWGEAGFVFYTHFASRKGQELAGNAQAALLFHWKVSKRQVRIEGTVTRIDDATSDAYFASRERSSQVGAWASQQSEPIEDGVTLEERMAEAVARFPSGTVPRPPGWGGYRVRAERIEFWEARPSRMHVRRVFQRTASGWALEQLYP